MSAARDTMPTPSLAVPRRLPVRALSASSIRRFLKCREQWRRHYLDREPDPVRPAMLAGNAYGAAVQASYWERIMGRRPLSVADADDLLIGEFEWALEEASAEGRLVEEEDAEGAREGARPPLRGYLAEVASGVREPRFTERELRARFPEAEWSFVGHLDVDCASLVIDNKLSGSNRWNQLSADRDLQAGLYLLLRYLADEPAERFAFHIARPGKEEIRVLETSRSPAQLAHLEARIALVAREIARCVETGDWSYAPEGAWWCAERWCSSWRSCAVGGALERVDGGEGKEER